MSRTTARAAAALAALWLAVPASSAAAPKRDLYVAVGDSYTAGYQPNPQGGVGSTNRNGFAYQLVPLARQQRGYPGVRLVNFGCALSPGGETTTTFLRRTAPCTRPGPGGVDYTGKTQMAASEAFLRRNRRRVAFVTVLIGGNDVTACAKDPDPVKCVGAASGRISANVSAIGRRLRAAVGPKVPIVGGTYPDVILGLWTTGREEDQKLAQLSTIAFRSIINPALEKAYRASRIKFVDVTAATGAYESFEKMTEAPGFGTVPFPVATICEISFYCDLRDIHLRTNGYQRMAELFAKALPRRG